MSCDLHLLNATRLLNEGEESPLSLSFNLFGLVCFLFSGVAHCPTPSSSSVLSTEEVYKSFSAFALARDNVPVKTCSLFTGIDNTPIKTGNTVLY